MFTYILLTVSSLIIIASGFFSLLDSNKNLKSFVLFGLLVLGALIALIHGIYSHIEAEKVNEQLIGYASGGVGNKPVLIFSLAKKEDGTYSSLFSIRNFGKYPLNNVRYEISDTYTVQADAYKALGLNSSSRLTEEQIMQLNKYQQEHQEKTIVQGNIPNISKDVSEPLPYRGKIIENMPAVMYLIKLTWNNNYYTAVYEFVKDGSGQYVPLDINITGEDGEKAADLKEFFPLVPAGFWGGFPTKLDSTSKVRQFEASN